MDNIFKITSDAMIINEMTCAIKHGGTTMCFTGKVPHFSTAGTGDKHSLVCFNLKYAITV